MSTTIPPFNRPGLTSKNEMMDAIVKLVGKQEARTLVLQAYNSEILANRIGRMEAKGGIAERFEKKDLLLLAITRVHEVVTLTG